MSQPSDPNPYQPPNAPELSSPAHSTAEGDATGGLIPYKNPFALIAYYLGIVGMFPCIGLVFAVPALVLGIMGLQARAKNPAIKGSVHAWIGIVLGGIFTLIWGACVVMLIVMWIANQR